MSFLFHPTAIIFFFRCMSGVLGVWLIAIQKESKKTITVRRKRKGILLFILFTFT